MGSFFSSRARPTFSVALPTRPRGRSFADAFLLIDGEGALLPDMYDECRRVLGREILWNPNRCMSVLVSETGRSRPGRR